MSEERLASAKGREGAAAESPKRSIWAQIKTGALRVLLEKSPSKAVEGVYVGDERHALEGLVEGAGSCGSGTGRQQRSSKRPSRWARATRLDGGSGERDRFY
jgi:hypothetical protein